ncbi:MAG: hypothetical protein ACOC4M_05900 [Promethearchaeia archaeon]
MTNEDKELEEKISEDLKKPERKEVKVNREERKKYTNIHLKEDSE